MKKLYFMALAAIAALSSCTSDNDLELNKNTGKEALTFTATMENSEATRATYDSENKYALWEAGDQISINGKTYSAQEGAGATATFKATTTGEEAEGPTYNAYFPADLYDGTTATLPAIQTYTAGKFNMPMYATSTTTDLAFKNLCAVLAIKVTSADITTLKSIKVASDKVMNGSFTVTDNKAVMGTDGTNAVVLESSTALTLTADGTTFYIAIPAQAYSYLNIFLSADGTTYTQAMATKKAAGIGAIARSTMFNIDYVKNATKLWKGNLFIADCNVGAKTATEYGGYYAWGGSQDKVDDHNTGTDALSGSSDTATKLWGSNWRMMTKEELTTLTGLGAWDYDGLLCESSDYADNSVFLPAAGYYYNDNVCDQNEQGFYWASSGKNNGLEGFALSFYMGSYLGVNTSPTEQGYSVRAVLEEAASPAPAAPATKGTAKRTGDIDVNWVQLWENGPKFAEYNVGAANNKAEDYGGYYTWGGFVDVLVDNNNNNPSYNTGTDVLSGDNDTATKLWGDKWRMPTKEEFDNLLAKCDVEWIDGSTKKYNNTTAKGLLCTGKAEPYSSNSIFLPAGGHCSRYSIVNYKDNSGCYRSSMPDDADNTKAYILHFESGSHSLVSSPRVNYSFSVRAVLNESAE